MTVRVKVCGITSREDASCAFSRGADYIGIIVDIAGSPRSVTIGAASLITSVFKPVVVLMEAPAAAIVPALDRLQPSAVQLVGHYEPDDILRLKQACDTDVWMTVHVPPAGGSVRDLERRIVRMHTAGLDAIVLDTLVAGQKGGTGRTCDWKTAADVVSSVPLPVFLAGGLTPDNVADAAAAVRPYGVDVSSGVEASPGHKDPEKVARFIKQSRSVGAAAT